MCSSPRLNNLISKTCDLEVCQSTKKPEDQVNILVGARDSKLSKIQCDEVLQEIKQHVPNIIFSPIWLKTTGDKDLQTSLRTLDRTDFFTKEIDQLQLQHGCRISIHSAKDLADPLPNGLKIACLTKGLDASDSLVLRKQDQLNTLPKEAKIGASSFRREEAIRRLREDFCFVDIRGTVEQRIALLDNRKIDGVVIATAALIRLGLANSSQHHLIKIEGKSSLLQGKLAVVVREEDVEMLQLFSYIDSR